MNSLSFTKKTEDYKNQIITIESVCSDNKIVSVKVLWDTGSGNTSISEKLCTEMGFERVDDTYVTTNNGKKLMKRYQIGVVLEDLDKTCFKVWATSSTVLDNEEFDIIIGMDIIGRGDFAISKNNQDYDTYISFRYDHGGIVKL